MTTNNTNRNGHPVLYQAPDEFLTLQETAELLNLTPEDNSKLRQGGKAQSVEALLQGSQVQAVGS
jgi:hypothetical protein